MSRPAPELRAPLALFRLSLISICALLSLTPHGEHRAFLVLFPLAVGAWGAYHSVRFAAWWPYIAGILTAAAIPFTGGGGSSLLPYLLASALSLGLMRGAPELLAMAGATSAVILAGPLVTDVGPRGDYFTGTAQWVLLSLAVGLVPLWSRHLRALPEHPNEYVQVRRLLEQLSDLARHLPGSLDAPAAAETLLARCGQVVQVERAAVIAQTAHDVFVPLAAVGVSRVPWRTPLADDGPLRQAWETGVPVRDSRRVDVVGRRRGSVLLALPMPSRHGPFALVVLESGEIDAFPANLVEVLTEVVAAAAPQVETALMFEEVRSEASNQERHRLAREMHDGIAQELAVLGYQLDQLGIAAQRVDKGLADEVAALRGQVTTVISELRLSITDLRTNVQPGRGLGAALSSYLPAVCSGREVVLNLSLDESPFRLPADQEAALLKSARAFAQEVRRTPAAQELTVQLVVDPPSACLVLSCDVPLPELVVEDVGELVTSIGGEVAVSEAETGEYALTITLRGHDDDDAAAGGRPRADQAGAATGVRAD